MLIAGPGRRGPYPVRDLLCPGAYDPHADTPHAPLLARAAEWYTANPHADEQRRQIEYITGRLHEPDTDPVLAKRLADIIRPRQSGAFG